MKQLRFGTEESKTINLSGGKSMYDYFYQQELYYEEKKENAQDEDGEW